MKTLFLSAAGCLLLTTSVAAQLAPIPDKLVVLTFDDSKASHSTVVRPLLKKYGFGATFFITEGFTFRTNKADYLTWEQIADFCSRRRVMRGRSGRSTISSAQWLRRRTEGSPSSSSTARPMWNIRGCIHRVNGLRNT
jgi:peptidoglycan/xylan/chitin deacetylase (PgdA/CDA1 family)